MLEVLNLDSYRENIARFNSSKGLGKSNALNTIDLETKCDFDLNTLETAYQVLPLAEKAVNTIVDFALNDQGLSQDVYFYLRKALIQYRKFGQAVLVKEANGNFFIAAPGIGSFVDRKLDAPDLEKRLKEKQLVFHYKMEEYTNFFVLGEKKRLPGYLSRILPAVLQYEMAIDASLLMLAEANIFKLSIPNLLQMLGDKETANLLYTRLDSLNECKSVANGLVLDSKEEAEFVDRSLSGIEAIVNEVETALVARCDYPRGILFGSSEASSMSNAGSSDQETFDKQVQLFRSLYLQPILKWMDAGVREVNYLSIVKPNPREVEEIEVMKSNRISALFAGKLISQETAQRMLALPIEKIEVTEPATQIKAEKAKRKRTNPSDMIES
jgi:Protein of unknown function (DUF1073)